MAPRLPAPLFAAIRFWLLALIVGCLAGTAAVLFRSGIVILQEAIYGESEATLHSHLATLPWWWVVLVPVAGGLAVGLILHRFTPDGRARTVAEVIEGAALNEGRVDTRWGAASTAASLITLSTGGSTGREGPVVHAAAVIASWISNRIRADGITARDLMGCAVAAAVSASFNAPIAGALFAMEVVLRHFAMHAFAPIVVASVAGAVISRLTVGEVTEFLLPMQGLDFYQELPAFMLLGLVCGLVATLQIRALLLAEAWGDALQARARLPGWSRPALAGAILGAIAIWFPHIIGVGYETTSRALTEGLVLREAVAFAIVKGLAVAITVGGRMGGGVFSPSLMLGALTGLAFGLVATAVFPAQSGTAGLYAVAGMGAVAASVLGAPISTALIVFEMTGDWQAGIAVLVTVSLSTALSARLVTRSYFLTQIELRGVHLAAGPQAYHLALLSAERLMRPAGDGSAPAETVQALVEQGAWVPPEATLETALPMLEQAAHGFVPVVRPPREDGATPDVLGTLHHVDALAAYNRALAATAREEHS